MRNNLSPEYQALLQKTFLFQNTDPALAESFLSNPQGEFRRYEPSSTIYSPSCYRRSLGFLLEGDAAVYKLAGEARLFMSHLKTGDFFGAAALFHSEPDYVTEIIAKSPALVFFMPQAALEEFFRKDFTLVQNYLSYLSGRILFLNRRLEDLARTTAIDKVFHYLLEYSIQGNFTLTLSWTEFASALGMSRASLYRILDQLEASGTIRRQGKHILLLKETIE